MSTKFDKFRWAPDADGKVTEAMADEYAEAAMCIWEWMLDQQIAYWNCVENHNESELSEIALKLGQIRENIGTCALRDVARELATPCNMAWYDIGAENFGDPFDWEFVPLFMTECVDYDTGSLGINLRSDWENRIKIAVMRYREELRAQFPGSSAPRERRGYDVFDTVRGFEIQRDDELGIYETDHDAAIACINDTLSGDVEAAEMLKKVLTQDREEEEDKWLSCDTPEDGYIERLATLTSPDGWTQDERGLPVFFKTLKEVQWSIIDEIAAKIGDWKEAETQEERNDLFIEIVSGSERYYQKARRYRDGSIVVPDTLENWGLEKQS